mgnify:CR=1 FL=1
MSDWIGLAVIGFIVLCGVVFLWWLARPYEVSVEEFDKRAHEAPSLLSAGFVSLQRYSIPLRRKLLKPRKISEKVVSIASKRRVTGLSLGNERSFKFQVPSFKLGLSRHRNYIFETWYLELVLSKGNHDQIHLCNRRRCFESGKRFGSIVDRMPAGGTRPQRLADQARSLYQRRPRHNVSVSTRRSLCHRRRSGN